MILKDDRGFTLIELVAAMVLMTIVTGMAYSFFMFISKETQGREKKSLSTLYNRSAVNQCSDNIRKAERIISLGQNEITIIKSSGDTAEYYFDNGQVFYNGKTLIDNVKQGNYLISINPSIFGPKFDELDLNMDGFVNGLEINNLKHITVNVEDTSGVIIYEKTVTIKNR